MGVDRIENLAGAIADKVGQGYERADILWNRIQDKMAKIINSIGGQAEMYKSKSIKARPKWEAVEDFFHNKISFNELKLKIGC